MDTLPKSDYWARGTPVTVYTDHRPLKNIDMRSFTQVENERVGRLMERIAKYGLTVRYLPGKQNVVADALSRIPRGWGEASCAQDSLPGGPLEEISIRHTFSTRSDYKSDPVLYEMASVLDEDYKLVASALKDGKLPADLDSSHPAQQYKQNWHLLTTLEMSPEADLVILDNSKLVVPKAFRPRLVRLYHHSHSGFQKMHASLAERFHWPSMRSKVKNHVDHCEDCQSCSPAGSIQPFREDMDSLATMLPMEQVSVDWVTLSGRHLHVVRDRVGQAFAGKPLHPDIG